MKQIEKPKLEDLLAELEYSIDFKVNHLHPGKWPSTCGNRGGFSIERFEPLSNYPDFRRIDLLATKRNPLMNEPMVRLFDAIARVDVIMLADLSPSLLCGVSEPKLFQVAKLAALFGFTAFSMGDRFGFLGFDNKLLPEFIYPPAHSRVLALEIGEKILNFHPSLGKGGVTLDLTRLLPERRALLIFVSDFYFDPVVLWGILKGLKRHTILPVMLRQEWERRWPRSLFGVLRMKDPETKRERVFFFSPRSTRRFNERAKENEEEIMRVFRSFSTVPIILDTVTPARLMEELERREG